jgi:hypothetical protein
MKISLGCTLLQSTNKQGKLIADADGYYTVCLGALEFPNPIGLVYSKTSFEKMLQPESPFMRRLRGGLVYGEWGHPKQEVGMSYEQWLRRLTVIEETRICMHITEVWPADNVVQHNGRYILAIMAKIRPEGPYGPCLERILLNGKANVAFSVRSLTKDNYVRGVPTKHFDILVGWDYVVEPGLAPATKYHLAQTAGLESRVDDFDTAIALPNSEIIVDPDIVRSMLNNNSYRIGMESSNLILQEMLTSIESSQAYSRVAGVEQRTDVW